MSLPNRTILVIDDDKKFSLGLVAVLRREGFDVINASNGSEGMAAIRATKPDIILCDIMMPSPNGIQLKEELSTNPELGHIPFIFLTARTAQVDKLAGLQSGADDYITKPFDVNELLARISNCSTSLEEYFSSILSISIFACFDNSVPITSSCPGK